MFELIFSLALGLVVGSFIGALSYRFPRGISIASGYGGRSICVSCKRHIRWFDNIPVLSYLILRGKCRDCKAEISIREPLVEIGTGLVFVLLTYFGLPLLIFVISAILIAIFVIDFEHQLIFDEFVWFGLALVLVNFLVTDYQFWPNLAAGLGASLFLLLVYFATFGRGMGLGDVKLAILIGAILGLPYTIIWMFTSFIIGGLVGVLLLVGGMAKLKQKVAFGPFLITGFFITLFWGTEIMNRFLPIF